MAVSELDHYQIGRRLEPLCVCDEVARGREMSSLTGWAEKGPNKTCIVVDESPSARFGPRTFLVSPKQNLSFFILFKGYIFFLVFAR
jgi:hypothetical protein